jgi:hypothetical protein
VAAGGDAVIAVDGFMPDAAAVRAQALAAPYIDWPGHDGEVYKRVCLTTVPGLQDALEHHVGPVHMLGMGYRLNFGGEMPNAAIHSDLGWGSHALVLYLSEGEGGTAFWRHKATGATRIDVGDAGLLAAVEPDWNDPDKWERHHQIDMAFNRAAIYESALFHSRYPFAAFGTGPDDGRLICCAFFNL